MITSGVWVHVFLALVQELYVTCHLEDGRDVSLNEQVAIFLYMCVTGLSIWHVAERFQCSNDTISMWVILYIYLTQFLSCSWIATSVKSLMHYQLGHFTRNTYTSLQSMIPSPNSFINHQNSSPILVVWLGLWMGHISVAVLQQKINIHPAITKAASHRTVLHAAHLPWNLYTSWVDGKDLLQMQQCMLIHALLISLSQQASFILLMQGLRSVIHYWSHIMEFVTTLQSGDEPI